MNNRSPDVDSNEVAAPPDVEKVMFPPSVTASPIVTLATQKVWGCTYHAICSLALPSDRVSGAHHEIVYTPLVLMHYQGVVALLAQAVVSVLQVEATGAVFPLGGHQSPPWWIH